LLGHPGPA